MEIQLLLCIKSKPYIMFIYYFRVKDVLSTFESLDALIGPDESVADILFDKSAFKGHSQVHPTTP